MKSAGAVTVDLDDAGNDILTSMSADDRQSRAEYRAGCKALAALLQELRAHREREAKRDAHERHHRLQWLRERITGYTAMLAKPNSDENLASMRRLIAEAREDLAREFPSETQP